MLTVQCAPPQASYSIHPQFVLTTMYNDLAIITLASPFTLNSKVAVMPLAASTATFSTGASCTVSGWGDTSSGMAFTFTGVSGVLLLVAV